VPRISPNGQHVAFFEYAKGEGVLATVDRAGNKQVLQSVVKGAFYLQRLCWTPDGKEIWFSSFDVSETNLIYAVNLNGKRRLVSQMPRSSSLQDISRNGKMLLTMNDHRTGIRGLAPGETSERDLSWLDASFLNGLTADGKMIAFTEMGQGGGFNKGIYVRATEGSSAIRLSEGQGGAISQDGKWVFVSRPHANPKYALVPTGAGEERPVVIEGLEDQVFISAWLSDGNYLVSGHETGKQPRIFVWSASGGRLRPVSPEGSSTFAAAAPDGQRFFVRGGDGKWYVYPINEGQAHLITGLGPSEAPINWCTDGHSLYTNRLTGKTIVIYRLDLVGGQKSLWKEIKPEKTIGRVHNLRITPDGRSYAYNYSNNFSDLYLVEGWK
jgi:eukaryotic-like serine/threonine-protein kinase